MPPVNVEAERNNYQVDKASSPKFTEPLLDTPRTITIIPKEVIRERGALSVTDVLRTVPGISLGAGEGGIAAGDRTFIRGYEARGDSFVDGARDLGAYFRDPFNIEQIEVLKGPGSSYAGRGSTGGLINYVTKAPQKDDFAIGALTFGTDQTKRGTVDVNKVVDNVGLRFNAMYHDSEVAGRDAVTQNRWGVAPSVTMGMDRDTRLTLSYYHFVGNNLPDYGHPFNTSTGRPIDVDRDNFYGLKKRDYDDAYADALTARVEHDFSEDFKLRNQTRFGIVDRNFLVTKPEYTPGQSVVVRSVRTRDTHDTALVNQTDVTSKFDTGFIKHTLVTGLEVSNEESKGLTRGPNNASLPAANFFHPNPNDPFSFAPSYTGAGTNVEMTTIGVYAFDTMKLSEQWEITGGLRWDHVDTDFTSIATNGAETPLGRIDKTLSYNAGIVYKPVPIGSIYVAYGTSFNPSAEFQSLSTATTTNDATVNTPPEKNRSYEIGTKWDVLKQRLSLTAAIFRTEKTNARINDPFGTDQVLDGKNRVDGVELGFAGNITDKWKAFGGYTYLDSKIVKSATPAEVGKEFANIAPHNFSLWTTYQITDDIGVGGGATYASARYANNTNTLSLPNYWRFDAMASYRLTENVDLQLNVLNLTNEFYYDSTHNGQHALVAPGRSALLTTTARF